MSTNAAIVADGGMKVGEVCKFLSASRPMVYQMMNRGQLPYFLVGQRRRIPRKAVIDLAANGLITEGSTDEARRD